MDSDAYIAAKFKETLEKQKQHQNKPPVTVHWEEEDKREEEEKGEEEEEEEEEEEAWGFVQQELHPLTIINNGEKVSQESRVGVTTQKEKSGKKAPLSVSIRRKAPDPKNKTSIRRKSTAANNPTKGKTTTPNARRTPVENQHPRKTNSCPTVKWKSRANIKAHNVQNTASKIKKKNESVQYGNLSKAIFFQCEVHVQ